MDEARLPNGLHDGLLDGLLDGLPNGMHDGLPNGLHDGLPNGLPNGPVTPVQEPNNVPTTLTTAGGWTRNPFYNVLLCVCGTISALHLAVMVDSLSTRYHICGIVVTNSALRMFDRSTISDGIPIFSDESVWTALAEGRILHEELCVSTDAILILPASSNTITKIAIGLSNNLLTNTVHQFTGPIFVVPDMHHVIHSKPTTILRVADLRAFGYKVMDPPNPPVLELNDEVYGYMGSFESVLSWLLNVMPLPFPGQHNQ